jgi:hypothetical protein
MRAPILGREILYDTLRDGSLRFLDWSLVNTELGPMLEPVSLNQLESITNQDPFSVSFDRLTLFDADQMVDTMHGGGVLVPCDYVNTGL